MRKLISLFLALTLVLCLASCGGEETAEPGTEEAAAAESEETPEAAEAADNSGAEITDEQLVALTEAYNQVAPLYNEAYTTAEANGWLADEQTAAEIEAAGGTLGFIGQALTEDLTLLDGSNFQELTSALLEFAAPLEELIQRVSVPYEG